MLHVSYPSLTFYTLVPSVIIVHYTDDDTLSAERDGNPWPGGRAMSDGNVVGVADAGGTPSKHGSDHPLTPRLNLPGKWLVSL